MAAPRAGSRHRALPARPGALRASPASLRAKSQQEPVYDYLATQLFDRLLQTSRTSNT